MLAKSIGERKIQEVKRLLALLLVEKYMKSGFNQ